MNAISFLYGGSLCSQAFQPVSGGKNALSLAIERAGRFPGVSKTVVLAGEGLSLPSLEGAPAFELVRAPSWTKKSLLEAVSKREAGYDLVYFAWADCPFLDPVLAGAVADRHIRYAAEYSYADGWPYGFAPEILSPGTSGILYRITGDDEGCLAPARNTLFSVLQKDINAFDIEAEISSVDLRSHRLSFSADSKRNLMLLAAFVEASGGVPSARDAESLITGKPALLRTLPNFYAVQVSGPCPQSCEYCPYPRSGLKREGFMESGRFALLLDKIAAFSGDAVIDLSLWGELSLHPEKMKLVSMVLARPELALVIETSGLGWKTGELEECARLALEKGGASRTSPLPPLSWIVSLDSAGAERYRNIRGAGFPEASECARKLLSLFPGDAYVQAVRMTGSEDDTEQFYRFWKEASPRGTSGVIIQKYDDFCGTLPRLQASDLSPVERQPCWHIMRDMPVLLDGTVPVCREYSVSAVPDGAANPGGVKRPYGNVFTDSLETIWSRGMRLYEEQCACSYSGPCAECDEYYTYNF
ncbi:MAG: spiro-SPASM protein [Treponema sp.]|jgi:spiro-SPASM protein|nr:spiro-SPASM protein [Treponema sp.]